MAHGPTLTIRLHRGSRQGNAESDVLYLLLLEPLLRSLASKAQGDTRHDVSPLVQAWCDDLLLIAHTVPQFLEYTEAIARYLADMGMSHNVCSCVYATTACISSIMMHLDPDNASAPSIYLVAEGDVPYLGLRLDPTCMASMKLKHVRCNEALLGWCKNTMGPASVRQEVMAVVVGGILRYAAPYLSYVAAGVVRLNVPINIVALQFENLPKDLSNGVVPSAKGLKLPHVRVLCRDSAVGIVAQHAHPRSTAVQDELWAMLDDLRTQYGVCEHFMASSTVFASHAGDTWIDRVPREMGTRGVDLLTPSSVYSCAHAHLPQVQCA